MSKFNLRVIQEDKGWTAEIFRKKTAKELVVTKKQTGFDSEDEARTWGEAELTSFVTEYNKRKRREKNEGK